MSKKEFAMVVQGEGGRQTTTEVRVMARAERYAMVRFKGCMPFVVHDSQLKPIPRVASTHLAQEGQNDADR
jgi:hypothetical protein